MSQHTPGPWVYDIHEHSFYIFAANEEMVADGDPDDIGIARMRGTGRGADVVEQEANAALIARAPELLDFAKQHFASTHCICKFLGYVDKEPPCDRCKLGALIAKAEGEI